MKFEMENDLTLYKSDTTVILIKKSSFWSMNPWPLRLRTIEFRKYSMDWGLDVKISLKDYLCFGISVYCVEGCAAGLNIRGDSSKGFILDAEAEKHLKEIISNPEVTFLQDFHFSIWACAGHLTVVGSLHKITVPQWNHFEYVMLEMKNC